MDTKLTRHCPKCKRELNYKCNLTFRRALQSNGMCRRCSQRKSHLCEDLSTQRFGRLVVVRRAEEDRKGRPQWICKCDCGEETLVTSNHLRTGGTRSCGCLIKELAGQHCRKAPFFYIFTRLNYTASKRNIPVSLSFEDFISFTKDTTCHYCGGKITWHPYHHPGGCNLDRKDPLLGYTKENCVVCCKVCNSVKNVYFSCEEMKELGKCIKNIFSRRTSDIYNQCKHEQS